MEKEPRCSVCDAPYSPKRKELGYTTCIRCGASIASKIAEARQGRVAPGWNKGGLIYITDETDLTALGRKI